jgi:hypothetical protein
MVSKEVNIGTVIISSYDKGRDADMINSFSVIGKTHIACVIGNKFLTLKPIDGYKAGGDDVFIDDSEQIAKFHLKLAATMNTIQTETLNILEDARTNSDNSEH